jgi:ParB/RepB/Spo0J family partition protein
MEDEDQVVLIPVNFIIPLPFNVSGRMHSELDDMLRKDMTRIESQGRRKIDPILIRQLSEEEIVQYKDKFPWAKYMIIDGYKRWEAARELGWKNIRAIIKDATLEEAEEINYKKNKVRGTVDPMREAAYFAKLHEKLTIDQIAEKFGLSHRRVEQILRRIKIAEPVKKILEGGESAFTPSPLHYEVLGTVKEPEKQKQLAEVIVKEKLSYRDAAVAKEAVETGLPPEKTVQVVKKVKKEKFKPKEAKVLLELVKEKPEEADQLLELPKEKILAEAKGEKIVETPAEMEKFFEEDAKPVEAWETNFKCPKCGAPFTVDWKLGKVSWKEN